MDERRGSTRLNMYAGVFILCEEKAFLTEVENVSTGGARVTRPRNWDSKLEGVCSLYFVIEQDNILRINGRVIHDDEAASVGFAFEPGFAVEAEELVSESRRWR